MNRIANLPKNDTTLNSNIKSTSLYNTIRLIEALMPSLKTEEVLKTEENCIYEQVYEYLTQNCQTKEIREEDIENNRYKIKGIVPGCTPTIQINNLVLEESLDGNMSIEESLMKIYPTLVLLEKFINDPTKYNREKLIDKDTKTARELGDLVGINNISEEEITGRARYLDPYVFNKRPKLMEHTKRRREYRSQNFSID